MNITYFIGNGFDVGLHLDTTYKKFYPYFLKNAGADNQLRKAIDHDTDFENWSDLEKALGIYTGKIESSGESANRFIKDKLELDDCLKNYLANEQKKFTMKRDEMKNLLINAFEQFKEGNNENERLLIRKTLDSCKDENYIYQCITFNYTKCIDQVWKTLRDSETGRHNTVGARHKEFSGNVLHIHGTLEDNEMITGVNDEKQISNSSLAQNIHVKWALIKPYLNQAIGQNKTQKAQKIIDHSAIVCVYGMSLGETDNIWWKYLGQWLTKQTAHILMIYHYAPGFTVTHPVRQLMHAENVKRAFLKRTDLTPAEQSAVQPRIIVYDNKNVFQPQKPYNIDS